MQKKQQDLAAPIIEKIKKLITEIGKEKSYTLILENNPSLLYLAPETDFTNEVIQRFEKK